MPLSPTQLDIANALGVSKMTVSFALRNSPEVSAAMRATVVRVAQEMGYRSSPYVRGFIAHHRHRRPGARQLPIAMLNLWDPPSRFNELGWSARLLAGANERAHELGYYIDEIPVRSPGMTASRVNTILVSRGIRGIILPPAPLANSHLTLDWRHFAAIAVGLTFRRPNFHRVALNISHAVELTLHRLKHAGYRRIGFLLNRRFVRRMNGAPESEFLYYQRTIPERDRVPVHWGSWYSFESGLRAWLKRYKPQVVVSYWDQVLEWLLRRGYGVPSEIGFVHLDVSAPEKWPHLPISGISGENVEIGRRAVELLVGDLERNSHGIPASPTVTLVTPRWIEGGTTRSGRS